MFPAGTYPASGLAADADGNFYGTTNTSFFRVAPDGTYSPLYTFVDATGTVPRGDLIRGSDGAFYGTTIRGGSTGKGTVYRIDSNGQFTKVAELVHEMAGRPSKMEGSGGPWPDTAIFG